MITVILLLAGLGWQTRFAFAGKQYDSVILATNETNTWKQVGRWFAEHAEPTDSIAMIPAGAIPARAMILKWGGCTATRPRLAENMISKRSLIATSYACIYSREKPSIRISGG